MHARGHSQALFQPGKYFEGSLAQGLLPLLGELVQGGFFTIYILLNAIV
jgi:hypothetical protein